MTLTSRLASATQARELQRQRRLRLKKARQLRWRHRMRRLLRAVIASSAIFLVALFVGFFRNGIGSDGLLLTFFLMAAAFVLFAIFPRTRTLGTGDSTALDLPALADRTQGWLETQRGLLPANTQNVVDLLGNRLDELVPRLASLSENDPSAAELRRLLGDHLPSLINSYTSIPAVLINQPHAGSTPAAQLHAGLETVAREVEAIGRTVASEKLDALAIRGRYLDTRYKGDDEQ